MFKNRFPNKGTKSLICHSKKVFMFELLVSHKPYPNLLAVKNLPTSFDNYSTVYVNISSNT